jgi:hypothetical protein
MLVQSPPARSSELADGGDPDVEEPESSESVLADSFGTLPDTADRFRIQGLPRGNMVDDCLGVGQNFGGDSHFIGFHKSIIGRFVRRVNAS